MPENQPNGGTVQNQNINNNNNGGNGGGADPNNKTDNSQPQAVDISKLGDEDFNKVFDDPRLWQHSRFKSLNDRAKKADELEAQQKAAEEERLKKQGEYKTLAEQKEAEANKWRETATNTQIDNRVAIEAAKVGVVDVEAVLKLIDRTNVKLDDNGNVIGVAEAVQALITSKPYLKGTNTPTIGTGTNPGGGNEGYKFKLSQLQNAKFYREHEKEILAAQKAGQIENDMPGMIG